MVARADFQRVLRPSSGGRPAGHPLSRSRGRRVVRAMKVLRIQLAPRKKNQVRVHLEGIEPLDIALDVMERSGIHVGNTVTAKDIARLEEDDTKWRVRQAALHLLSYRPRAEHELRIRLRSKGFPHATVEWCLRLLEEQGLIDDHAFCVGLRTQPDPAQVEGTFPFDPRAAPKGSVRRGSGARHRPGLRRRRNFGASPG